MIPSPVCTIAVQVPEFWPQVDELVRDAEV
jgi:hypothetical protein